MLESLKNMKSISIFNENIERGEFHKTMRDIASLSGVLNELSGKQMYQSPLEIIQFLRLLELLKLQAVGLAEAIDGEEMLLSRYCEYYQEGVAPSNERVKQIINTLSKHSWISKESTQLKLLDRGKRMIDSLIRLANDSLAYHMQDDISRLLFQAKRDTEISEAYDSQGVSGDHTLASMIQNLEDATDQIESRQLEFLADKNALPQLEKIHFLMMELDKKLSERLLEEEVLNQSPLISRGKSSIKKGTALSSSLLNKYNRFTLMKDTPLTGNISLEKVRQFIIAMYEPPNDSNIPNAHEILSFMEQGLYEDEVIDGIWLPIKFTAPISHLDIEDSIDYLENYEPQILDEDIKQSEILFEELLINQDEIDEAFQEASWQMTKAMISTDNVEQYLENNEEAEVEQLIIESASPGWGDSIRTMLALSALVGNHKITEESKKAVQTYDKEWEWINDDDRKFTIKQYNPESKSVNDVAKS